MGVKDGRVVNLLTLAVGPFLTGTWPPFIQGVLLYKLAEV